MKHKSCRKNFLSALALSAVAFFSGHAQARHSSGHHGRTVFHSHRSTGHHHSYAHVIQCVAYAKTASEVVLHGNARDWWYNAAGVYARGSAPQSGSVLNFRAIRRMPLGHVAVVRSVEDSRTIYIDQSHWASNGVAHNVRVVDVSPNNDWSAVRVALNDRSGRLGSIYPTYGFIYPHSDNADSSPAPRVVMARASKASGFRHRAVLSGSDALSHPMSSTEVAEAPDDAFTSDAPDRSIR
ncbi:CHAP domain-containing protein [Gluconobacter sp. Dm-62]|uniref:CHAP domain-containing protein n=1 Tax=Gluconobacter sp. Dm-62 TaxID=2799804 RepID=UPI001B8CFDBF|nr:CHAP domain-containing protein [Gluconobacter sp. Dm-62]